MKAAIERLAKAVGYPEKVPEGALSFTFRVDGAEIHAEEAEGRIVLSRTLSDDASILPMLAQYAAGRMLREDATLSYGLPDLSDSVSRRAEIRPSSFLWQDAPSDANADALRRAFETFLDSCDWWRARVDALLGGEAAGPDGGEMMMIRP